MIDWVKFNEHLPPDYKSLILDLIALFIDGYSERISTIQKAVEEKDYTTLRKYAHDMKSNCGTFGGTVAMELALQLEIMGINKVDTGMDNVFKQLVPATDELLQELQVYRKNLAG
jgi:HPt (histidine-containing phosphotransfer) domain-containing protein